MLLAGDAAHIHYPAGGQGLNIGVQDAVNLGWKLAAVVRGEAPADLLDSYHAERHPVAERVLHNTRAQSALARPGAADGRAARGVRLAHGVRRRQPAPTGSMITGLDIRYPIDGDHPLAGRRVPDADLKTADGTTRVYELLHAARPVLLDLRGTSSRGGRRGLDRSRRRRRGAQRGRLLARPGLGEIPAPPALLVRPDGHVAWAAADTPDISALRGALTTWFGPAAQG